MICAHESDIFADDARDLVFQVTQAYAEPLQLTGTEIVFRLDMHDRILNEGARYQEFTQKIAALQAGPAGRSAAERLREIIHLADQGTALVRALTPGVTIPLPATAVTLDHYCQQDPGQGQIKSGIALARSLGQMKNWQAKIDYCLDLYPTLASPQMIGMVDQLLSEMLRIKGAAEHLFGADPDPIALSRICLAIAGDSESQCHLKSNRLVSRWLDACQGRDNPRIVSVCRLRLKALLEGTKPLIRNDTIREWAMLLHLKRRIGRLKSLDPMADLSGLLTKRIDALIASPKLNELLAQEFLHSRKVLMALKLLAEVSEQQAKSRVLTVINDLFETLDVRKDMTGADVREIAATFDTLIAAISACPDIASVRKAKFIELLKSKAGGGPNKAEANKRGNDRSVASVDDCVLFHGQKVKLKNWSPHGLLFGPITAFVSVTEKIDLTVLIRQPFLTLNFDAEAEVVRFADGIVAARYKFKDRTAEQKVKAFFG
jgi:hypothetical protein